MNGSISGGVGIEAGESHLKGWRVLPNPDWILRGIAMFGFCLKRVSEDI